VLIVDIPDECTLVEGSAKDQKIILEGPVGHVVKSSNRKEKLVMTLKPVMFTKGTDPEGFFTCNGKIIGAEKVIPKKGLGGRVVLDGVQFEIHTHPSYEVSVMGQGISLAFQDIKRRLDDIVGRDVRVCFDGVVEVDQEELDTLSPETRVLGCQPSQNAFGTRPILVDAKTYRKRSAGGHLHLGLTNNRDLYQNRTDLVPVLAILVANTCVMLDRDPGQAERRQLAYGRAGEFRLQDHGLEYRTLSNFWLRHYALMDLVFGLANLSISVVNARLQGNDIEQELADVVNIGTIIEAVETNNFDMARKNFDRIRPFLVKYLPSTGFPLTPKNIDAFLTMTDGVEKHGIQAYFPQDPVEHWCAESQVSFRDFLEAK
jgi:hypothetical protein